MARSIRVPRHACSRSARLPRHRVLAVAVLSALLAACNSSDDNGGGGGGGQATINPYSNLSRSVRDVSIELREGTNMAAAPSPDGSRVVFSAQGALWIMPIAGGNATRITNWDVEPTAPVWAPDGQTIAFQNYTPDGNYHVWTIRPDGTDIKEITTGPFDDREPAWMPDGRAVVFSSDRSGDGQYKIWRAPIDGGAPAQVTTGPGAESNPVVSPDGRTVAYVNQVTTGATTQARVFSAPMAGGAPPQEVAPGTAPAWLPDGSGLVYQTAGRTLTVRGREVAGDEDLFQFPVRFLSDGRFMYTSDGKIRIRNATGDARADVPFTATLAVRRPVRDRVKDHGFSRLGPQPVRGISSPALSPDGQSVAFVALNDVWVMRIGQAPVRLTDDTDRDGTPQWTRDGSAVYFSSEKANGGQLAIDRVDVATRARTRLGRIAGKSMVTPSLSPTGDRIAYTTLSGQLEIWDIAAKTARVVAPSLSTQVSTPQWTPDGSRIVLVDNERINNRFREGYNKLRVIDVATGTARFHAVAPPPRQVSDREEGAAMLSPDGRRVAFVMDSVLHVMPVNADGSPAGAPVQITTEAADLPSWGGDSNTILYKAGEKLRLVNADGSGARDVPVTLEWAQAAGTGTTVIRAGRLWNGLTATLQPDVDIVVQGNRITAIRPHDPAAAATATRFIDASGLTVMPGLIDTHIHPLTLYQGGQFGQISALMMSYGITTALSVAGPLHQSIEMRESLEAGKLLGPRLFVSPPLWEGNRQFYSFARTLRTPQVADMEIAKAVAMGADFLKAYVRAPIPIMVKIAQAGLDYGVPTGTHMLSPGSAAGIWGTTHLSATQRMGYGWAKSVNGLISYQDAVQVHAGTDFHVIDTLFSSLALTGQDPSIITGDRFNFLVPPNFLVGLTNTANPTATTLGNIDRDARQAQKVQNAGGLVAVGTDSPLVAPGIALHTGLRAYGRVDNNHRALQNVTINAAQMAFIERDLGSVEVGKLADLVVVGGNPLDDLKAAADVRWVVKNGVPYSLDQITAPFKAPAVVAARKQEIAALKRLCRKDPHGCGPTLHAH